MPPSDAELTEFLVRQHLTMSHLSQRRDLSDPEEIERFAEKVGDEEHLIQLYLLTMCDTAMTAPDNLTAWKADLLLVLLRRTRAHFQGANGPPGSGMFAMPSAADTDPGLGLGLGLGPGTGPGPVAAEPSSAKASPAAGAAGVAGPAAPAEPSDE